MDLAKIQVIDYSSPDQTAAFRLIGAIFALPKGANLPDPLPTPPEMPKSYVGDIGDRINASSLDMDEQLAIVGRLEDALGPFGDPDDHQAAAEMLRRMAGRQDLFVNVARRIERIQAHPPNNYPPPSAVPPRQTASPPRPAKVRAFSSHWVMALVTCLLTFPTIILSPIGFIALAKYSRANSAYAVGDLGAARKSSTRVVIAFWVTIGLWATLIIAVIATANGSNSGGGTGLGTVNYLVS